MSTAVAELRAPARPKRSQKKLIFFLLFGAATIFVTYMKNARIFDPSSPIAQHFAPAEWYLIPHAFFAGLAMLLGAFQFSNRLRARYLKVHRVMGYIYVVGVFVGAPIAIPLAAKLTTPSLTAASVVQAFGWVACTAIALFCIRRGNIAQHRRWMIRSYPFAMVFTVARLIVPIPAILASGFAGIEVVVWTCVALAAFLPSILLEWKDISVKRKLPAAA